ncbi:MAG: glycosyltransferase family 4 protein [Nitrospina sp.]|nr:glycosyltransferase family 4 protein [Nitrospina sp.]MBT3876931.1 glycosyltransferase family 4 protein [Nitrospina sp.]MBT4047941.1 glycosyltransferase family 4 protein [Nitrospina sp.]MBT4558849.1 glycosyltransferase family 4 protein [Nitrospina sp.]MBT5348369.1 glycosyltransferase family 4 protein [Nitrospina sp.]
MKICLLCFDISNNSFGRTALLASALATRHDVEIIGTSRNGDIWYPMRNIDIPVRIYSWKRYPAFFSTIFKMVREMDADIFIACKLRPTSFGIALLKKWFTGKPVMVDIEDWELGFYYHSGFWGRVGRFLNFSNPNGLPYTWLMEKLIGFADSIIVSNKFLQNRFTGCLIPHCRDTTILDPDLFNDQEIKQSLGLEGNRVIMFLGTPRPHKGIDDLIQAVESLDYPDVRLVFIGAEPSFQSRQGNSFLNKKKVVVLPKIPFDELPKHLSAADILVVPQRDTTDTQGQIPAKLFDAMAMAIPVITTHVSDIPEVLGGNGYLVQPGKPEELTRTLKYVLDHPEEAKEKGLRARQRCVDLYDIKVMETKLQSLIEKLVDPA